MNNLLNGEGNGTKYVPFQEFYDEHNERQKTVLRAKLSLLFNLTEVSIYRKIRRNDFNTHELRKMYYHFQIAHCSQKGFFLDSNVSEKETLQKYGLTL